MTFDVTIKGIAPILFHRFAEEKLTAVKKKTGDSKLTDEEKRERAKEFLYVDKKKICTPSSHIEGTIAKAASEIKLSGSGKKTYKDLINEIGDKMDLDRTNELFNSSIKRSDTYRKELYTEDDIRKQRVILGYGNLHVKTAQVKMGLERMKGYRVNTEALKKAVDRKIRNKNKYGRKAS